MRFLVDMNLSPLWVEWFKEQGHMAQHWSSLGAADASDSQLMTLAQQEDWIILSSDLDFGALLAFSKQRRPSVILLRTEDCLPSAAGPALADLLSRCAAELDTGALAVLDLNKSRIRLLPL